MLTIKVINDDKSIFICLNEEEYKKSGLIMTLFKTYKSLYMELHTKFPLILVEEFFDFLKIKSFNHCRNVENILNILTIAKYFCLCEKSFDELLHIIKTNYFNSEILLEELNMINKLDDETIIKFLSYYSSIGHMPDINDKKITHRMYKLIPCIIH